MIPSFQAETENRIPSWNHELVPICLRTQLALHVLEQERSIEKETNMRQPDQISKQVSI
jgi:hypothetical protein